MTNPTWAGRSATPPTPENDNERAGWIPVAGVIAALGLVGAGGYVLGSTDDGDAIEAASGGATTTQVEVLDETDQLTSTATQQADDNPQDNGTGQDDDTGQDSDDQQDTDDQQDRARDEGADDPSTSDGSDAGDEAPSESDDPPGPQVVIEEGEVRGAVLRNGVLYLGGEVPSREFADQIIERAAAVVGEDNIVDEYVINPDATVEQGAPLYVDDVVLFAYGANRYDPAFEPLLDLGLALLLQNPSVTVTIITHTDASGSASFNDRLSYQRGQSVAQYWVDRGVPVEQIVIDARGERDPRAANDSDEGAQLNRRAEFYIEGLLP